MELPYTKPYKSVSKHLDAVINKVNLEEWKQVSKHFKDIDAETRSSY